MFTNRHSEAQACGGKRERRRVEGWAGKEVYKHRHGHMNRHHSCEFRMCLDVVYLNIPSRTSNSQFTEPNE